MGNSSKIVSESVFKGTSVIYYECEKFIANTPFMLLRPYLIILNNTLRALIIISTPRTMDFGDTRE